MDFEIASPCCMGIANCRGGGGGGLKKKIERKKLKNVKKEKEIN